MQSPTLFVRKEKDIKLGSNSSSILIIFKNLKSYCDISTPRFFYDCKFIENTKNTTSAFARTFSANMKGTN